MKDNPQIDVIQRHVAKTSVTPSSLRSQVKKGGIKKTREFFSAMNLKEFAVKNEKTFRKTLDQKTKELKTSCKKYDMKWGSARKALNIFLRSSLYNKYLRDHSGLEKAGKYFEVPLDNIIARNLKKEVKELNMIEKIPKWEGVKNLKKHNSKEFQEIATKIAKKKGVWRVHLDAMWWSKG